MYRRRIAVVGDMHVGSIFALWPEGYVTPEGNDLSAQMSKGQKGLLEYWNNFVELCNKDFKVDTVFLLGDLLQGVHRKEYGKDLMTADLADQMEACLKLLEPLCKGKRVAAVSGTKYHEAMDLRIYKTLARRLKGKYLGTLGHLRLRGTKLIFRLLHGDSSASIYRTTVMDRELLFQRAAENLGRIPPATVTVGGHWHWFAHLRFVDRQWVQAPAWMVWFPWKGTNYARMQPDLGGVVLLVSDEDKVEVHPVVFATINIADRVESL